MFDCSALTRCKYMSWGMVGKIFCHGFVNLEFVYFTFLNYCISTICKIKFITVDMMFTNKTYSLISPRF